MKVFKKLILMIMMCLLVLPFADETAYASSGTISLSDPTASVGESVSVTLKATTTDSSTIESVNMELTYDAKILEFVSGTSATGEAGTIKVAGTADSSIKTYTLTFNALKSGTSSIKISSYEIKDSNSSTIKMSKVGSSTVTISGDGTTNSGEVLQTESATPTDSTTQDVQTQEQVAQESLEHKIVSPPKKVVKTEIAGTPFNICKITEDVIPEGFEYIGYMYDGQAVDALKKDNIILFYLNQIGEQPTILYLYDSEREGFFKYAPVTPSLNYSVVGVDENVVIPEGFTETEVSVGGIAVNSWQSNTNSEYYLLYLMTSEGDKNLYLYDAVEKTVQRYYDTISDVATTGTDYQMMYTELNANYNKDIQKSSNIMYVLIILAVVLLIIIINLGLRLSDKHHLIMEEDDEEEEEQEFEEYEFENEDSEDQDNFEDDYDDYEVVNKKEMKKLAKLEKKEKAKKAKAIKNQKKSSKEELKDELEIDEDDFDDSDDFELEIFDLNDEKN